MITILGSTGTIGKNTLSVLKNSEKKGQIFALSANKNIRLLFLQIKVFNPRYAVIMDESDAIKLIDLCKKNSINTKILFGKKSLSFVSSHKKCTCLLSAIVGAAALQPTYDAVKSGKKILLANKESLIMSGKLLLTAAKKSGATLIPVDSEHNAVLQILSSFGVSYNNQTRKYIHNKVKMITLTASGGPFLNFTKKKLEKVTPEQAINHPTWKMGKKISVDSASMMNKGLEVIEAAILFGLKPKQIDVLIHPQSIVHALVKFTDGSVISHMSPHDMRIAISYALSWPERSDISIPDLKKFDLEKLTFQTIKPNQFECLDLCLKALKIGDNAPTILNAANEIAVEKFLQNKIKFIDIPVIIDKALRSIPITKCSTIKSILACDQHTRDYIRNFINIKWK